MHIFNPVFSNTCHLSCFINSLKAYHKSLLCVKYTSKTEFLKMFLTLLKILATYTYLALCLEGILCSQVDYNILITEQSLEELVEVT